MKYRLGLYCLLVIAITLFVFNPDTGVADMPCPDPVPIGCEQQLVDGFEHIPTLRYTIAIECRKSIFEPSCKGTQEIYDYQPVADFVCVSDVLTVDAVAGYVLVDCSKCPAGTIKVPFTEPVTTGRYCVGVKVGYYYP